MFEPIEVYEQEDNGNDKAQATDKQAKEWTPFFCD